MSEVWKDVVGYEGYYKVSNLGNVKSLNYMNTGHEKNLIPKVNNRGRQWVELSVCGKRKVHLVYRLVATAFIPNIENLPEVNHKDEDINNNAADNLEWCTRKYNVKYSYDRHPERHDKWNAKCKVGKKNKALCKAPINQYDLNGNFVKQWPNARTIFSQTKMSDWSIGECCRGNRKQAYGFKWQYAI